MRRAVARQQPDGRWKYPGGNPDIRSRAAYDQLETYRQLGVPAGKQPRRPGRKLTCVLLDEAARRLQPPPDADGAAEAHPA